MGDIADMMIGGVLCEGCGVVLNCVEEESEDSCEDMGIPMYCSIKCAKDRSASKEQVCPH
jgi:hypothetical protein